MRSRGPERMRSRDPESAISSGLTPIADVIVQRGDGRSGTQPGEQLQQILSIGGCRKRRHHRRLHFAMQSYFSKTVLGLFWSATMNTKTFARLSALGLREIE